jgi:hypothetical protein
MRRLVFAFLVRVSRATPLQLHIPFTLPFVERSAAVAFPFRNSNHPDVVRWNHTVFGVPGRDIR